MCILPSKRLPEHRAALILVSESDEKLPEISELYQETMESPKKWLLLHDVARQTCGISQAVLAEEISLTRAGRLAVEKDADCRA